MLGGTPSIDVAAHTVVVTWGISDPLFLGAYSVIAGVSVLAAVLWRWRAVSRGDRDREPNAIELGYLIDGPLGACFSSLAGLWRTRAVATAPLSTIRSRGEPTADKSKLTRALHQALRTPQSWPAAVADGPVRLALWGLQKRLIRRGWLIDEDRAARIRMVALPVFGLAAVGVLRLAAVVNDAGAGGRPGAEVGLLVEVVATLAVATLLLRRPRMSAVARREVRWARRRMRYLSPRGGHNWGAASPKELMFAVALYGPAVLWACDPRLASVIGTDSQERARDPVDVELAVVEGIGRARRRRRRVRLWGSGPGAGNLDWIVDATRPSRFWRLVWWFQRVRRAL